MLDKTGLGAIATVAAERSSVFCFDLSEERVGRGGLLDGLACSVLSFCLRVSRGILFEDKRVCCSLVFCLDLWEERVCLGELLDKFAPPVFSLPVVFWVLDSTLLIFLVEERVCRAESDVTFNTCEVR